MRTRRPPWRAFRVALERALTGWAARCVALTAVYVAAGYVVTAALGLHLHWPLSELMQQANFMMFVAYVPLTLGWLVAAGGRQGAFWQRCRTLLFSPVFFLELVAALVVVHATLAVSSNLLQYLPAINERLHDSPLWRLDAWLHGGFEPAVVATEYAAEHGLLPWLDEAYAMLDGASLVVPVLFLISARLRPVRGRFFFAYSLVSILGLVLAVAWPTLGPALYRSSRFVWLDQALHTQHLQQVLLEAYALFRTDPGRYAFGLDQGIAALPNLQVAQLALFAIAAVRIPALSFALWLLAALSLAASLALGWHYAVAGYAGVLLAVLAWGLASLAVPLQRPDRDVVERTLPRRSAVA
ncbi:MAG TPA: phosphatase PAP2 family protein [Candidatus Binatia bacterium]